MSLSEIGSLVLVGAGKMGGAMLHGWLAGGLPAAAVTVVDPHLGPEGQALVSGHGLVHLESIDGLVAAPQLMVLAIKPQMMAEALPALAASIDPSTLVVSIAAGTTLGALAAALGGGPIVRVMPNTPAQVGKGMAVAVGNSAVTAAHRDQVTALLDAVGKSAWVDDEALIDAVTAVSGSGPAYVFLMVEALAAAGVELGLSGELAMRLARQTVVGAGALLDASPLDAATLRRNVTSPGGTTAAALSVLMADGALQPLLAAAAAAAARRSRELAG